MARYARQAARFDQVWWLVSPQNPLKSKQGMAPFAQRLVSARDVSQPYSWIMDLSKKLSNLQLTVLAC